MMIVAEITVITASTLGIMLNLTMLMLAAIPAVFP